MSCRGDDPGRVGIHPGRAHWWSMQVSQPWLALATPAIFIIPLGAGEGEGNCTALCSVQLAEPMLPACLPACLALP
jgi:hypothetical protein